MDKLVSALRHLEIVEGDMAQGKRIATEEADSKVAYGKIMELISKAETRSNAEYDALFYKKYPRPLYLGGEWGDSATP